MYYLVVIIPGQLLDLVRKVKFDDEHCDEGVLAIKTDIVRFVSSINQERRIEQSINGRLNQSKTIYTLRRPDAC